MPSETKSPDVLTCPIEHVNTFDPEFLQDPYPFYERMRREAPVYRDPNSGIVSISTDEYIREANLQPKIFSNDFSSLLRSGSANTTSDEELEIMSEGVPVVDTMLTADPPTHTRYRKLAMKAFTYKRVLGMEDYIIRTSERLLDSFIDAGECDFKSAFSNMLPMYVIVDSLGAPRKDFDKFKRWSDAMVGQLGGMATPEERIHNARAIIEFQKYFIEKIEQKREAPTEDVISDLVHADLSEEGDNRKMEHSELLSIIQQILVAGNESTANSIAAGLYYILTHPDQHQAILVDPSLIPNFCEETLRFLSPSNNMWRAVKEDVTIGGVDIKAGEAVLLRYGSGNRDAARYENGEHFNIKRQNAKEHLAFGHGIHTCIGAQLARMEMKTAYKVIFERLKNIRLSDKQKGLRYTPNILLRGPTELYIEFDKA